MGVRLGEGNSSRLRFVGILSLVAVCSVVRAHVLDEVPLIDGHNDLPNNIWMLNRNRLSNFSFDTDLSDDPIWGTNACPSCFTDLPRLRSGKVGAQFWVAFVGCDTQYRDAVARTLEQIDVIKRLVKRYPDDMELVTDVQGIWNAFKARKVGSLIGVEGGHSMDSRAALLRVLYELGVRYMTLTHNCPTPWADSSYVDISQPIHNLTIFGEFIVREMNRLGMMVDLSHVSHNVMNEAIAVSRAPIIFSHSGAYAINAHHRNVRDDTLRLLPRNGGIVMANFVPDFLTPEPKSASINDVIKHINHIVDIAGIDHVGIGADFDGIQAVPEGLEDVSKYPDLFDRLAKTNPQRWTTDNLKKLAGLNLIRVFSDVEKVRDSLAEENEEPMQQWISIEDLKKVEERELLFTCRTFLNRRKEMATMN